MRPACLSPAPSVAFTRSETRTLQPPALVALVQGLLADFAAVLRPIAIDLELCCVHADHPIRDHAVRPPRPRWRLRSPAPPDLEIAAAPDAELVHAPQLDAAAVRDLLTRALGQPLPLPGRAWALRELRVSAAQALVCDPSAVARASLELDAHGDTHTVPLQIDAHGAWLGGPGPALAAPPLAWVLDQGGAAIGLDLQIAVSLWSDVGSREHDLLARCARRLLATWSLDGPDRVFELDVTQQRLREFFAAAFPPLPAVTPEQQLDRFARAAPPTAQATLAAALEDILALELGDDQLSAYLRGALDYAGAPRGPDMGPRRWLARISRRLRRAGDDALLL